MLVYHQLQKYTRILIREREYHYLLWNRFYKDTMDFQSYLANQLYSYSYHIAHQKLERYLLRCQKREHDYAHIAQFRLR